MGATGADPHTPGLGRAPEQRAHQDRRLRRAEGHGSIATGVGRLRLGDLHQCDRIGTSALPLNGVLVHPGSIHGWKVDRRGGDVPSGHIDPGSPLLGIRTKQGEEIETRITGTDGDRGIGSSVRRLRHIDGHECSVRRTVADSGHHIGILTRGVNGGVEVRPVRCTDGIEPAATSIGGAIEPGRQRQGRRVGAQIDAAVTTGIRPFQHRDGHACRIGFAER